MESRGRHFTWFLSLVVFIALCRCTQGQSGGGGCPADGRTWVPFGQSCYHFVHGEEEDVARSYSIQKAEEMCSGFALLTVRNAEVNKFIVEYSPSVWKGTTDVWLGMYYDSDVDEFKWKDETPVSFKNWADEPSDDLDIVRIDLCVTLHSTSGKWDNVSCSIDHENGVVCEAPIQPRKNGSRLLTAIVILSVIVILGVSAVFWFLQERQGLGSSLLPSFEYHPPFKSPSADQTCLVEAEEINEIS